MSSKRSHPQIRQQSWRIDIGFLTLAAVCLVGGVALGIGMGIAHDFELMPVHAHLNLVGWASLALFGLTYKAYPEMAASRLGFVHFALAVPAALLFPLGIYLAVVHEAPGLAIAASLVWFAGVLIFLANLLRLTFARPGVASASLGITTAEM